MSSFVLLFRSALEAWRAFLVSLECVTPFSLFYFLWPLAGLLKKEHARIFKLKMEKLYWGYQHVLYGDPLCCSTVTCGGSCWKVSGCSIQNESFLNCTILCWLVTWISSAMFFSVCNWELNESALVAFPSLCISECSYQSSQEEICLQVPFSWNFVLVCVFQKVSFLFLLNF